MASSRLSPPVLLAVVLLVAFALTESEEIRGRAADGLGRGMPAREAELARGFVLGEDEGIDARTKEDFRRAGLGHLLAVSGQNVTLLALLAMPLLGALGIPLRERLIWILGLIVVYVPVAGAGPSIQRAGVMGALGVLATLGGRRGSRLYGLILAAMVTLAVDPAIAGDIGWQLSFAAVLGILLLARPFRQLLTTRPGSGPWRRALAEGVAVTVAATVATAPLVAFHFETFSTTSLPANVIALPAVAPAMWLGMCVAGLSQLPWVPLEPLNGLNALLLGYIAEVASWCARPSWAELRIDLGTGGLLAAYLVLALAALLCARLTRARRIAVARARSGGAGPFSAAGSARVPSFAGRSRKWTAVALVAAAAAVLALVGWSGGQGPDPPARGLRVMVLDVGQGDAILLQPAAAPAVLIDGGPPGAGLARKLEEAGVTQLGAAIVTHEQADHVGGIEELLGEFPVEHFVFANLSQRLVAEAAAAGAAPERVAAGRVLRVGRLHLRVLWPPRELALTRPLSEDANRLSMVIKVRWRDFTMLLTGDAEAESAPIEPGPIDVLKVAHHGSDDAGLSALLDRARPQLAVISVGAGNSHGHPTPETLSTLARSGVPTRRTDRDGTVIIEVAARTFRLDR